MNKTVNNTDEKQKEGVENKTELQQEDLLSEIGYLKDELLKNSAEIEHLKDKFLRSSAEIENMRKRSEKQIQEERQYVLTSFAKNLIEVIDNLDRAIIHRPDQNVAQNQEVTVVLQGVEMILNQLKDVLEKHGICEIKVKEGDAFDHNIHQAISYIQTDKYPKGSIAQIMQVGYNIKERLLRPASVSIAQTLKQEEQDEV